MAWTCSTDGARRRSLVNETRRGSAGEEDFDWIVLGAADRRIGLGIASASLNGVDVIAVA